MMAKWLRLGSFVGCLASSCAGSSRCITGASAACTCTDGRSGAQLCMADGTLGMCACTGGAGGGGGSNDPCAALHPTDAVPTMCSLNDAASAQITFINNCTVSVKQEWVDYACAEMEYATIAPGQSWVQPTYVTHPWRIRDAATNRLLKEVPAPTNGTPYSVSVP